MTTLSNAVAVLRLFGPDRPELTVTEVSRLLGMPKSSVSRLLRQLKDVGLLEITASQRYAIGSVIFEVARLHRTQSAVLKLAEEALGGASAETGHTGYISILDGADVMVLRVQPGSRAIQVVTPLGERVPAVATAVGRSLLARLPDEHVRTLTKGQFSGLSEKSPKTFEELRSRLDTVRRQGWAEADDEALPGVGSIAISLGDSANGGAFALCLSYSTSLVPRSERDWIASLLTGLGRRIAEKVNDPFWLSIPRSKPDPAPAGVGTDTAAIVSAHYKVDS